MYQFIYDFIFENFTQGTTDTTALTYWNSTYTVSQTVSTIGTYVIMSLMVTALVLLVIGVFKYFGGLFNR